MNNSASLQHYIQDAIRWQLLLNTDEIGVAVLMSLNELSSPCKLLMRTVWLHPQVGNLVVM